MDLAGIATLDHEVVREADSGCLLGESPAVGRDGVVTWVDAERGEVCYLADGPATRHRVVEGLLSAAVPTGDGGLLLFHDRSMLSWAGTDAPATAVARLPGEPGGERFNDAKAGPDGRVWAGTVTRGVAGGGGLWSFRDDEGLVRRCAGITHGNGLGWTADGETLIAVDSGTGTVSAYPVDAASGDVGAPVVVLGMPRAAGIPDGLAMDDGDGVWLAVWGGHCLLHIEDGAVRGRIPLPARNVTSCAFVADDTLLVTSAADDITPDQPGGATWLVRVDRRRADVPLATPTAHDTI